MNDADQILHDISTPLTNIIMEIEDLQINNDDEAPINDKSIQNINDNLQRIRNMMQSHSRDIQAIDKCGFSPDRILRQYARTWKKPYQVNCLIHSTGVIPKLFGNPEHFITAISHLLNNAAESYEPATTNRLINVQLLTAMHSVVIMIADHGRGMPILIQVLSWIRNVSFGKARSGLGLPAAKKIIQEEFHGKIRLFSWYHYGTIAIVVIPVEESETNVSGSKNI